MVLKQNQTAETLRRGDQKLFASLLYLFIKTGFQGGLSTPGASAPYHNRKFAHKKMGLKPQKPFKSLNPRPEGRGNPTGRR